MSNSKVANVHGKHKIVFVVVVVSNHNYDNANIPYILHL